MLINGSSCESSNSPILLTVFLFAAHGYLSDYSNSSVNIINILSIFGLEPLALGRPTWIHISHRPNLMPMATRIPQTGFQKSFMKGGSKEINALRFSTENIGTGKTRGGKRIQTNDQNLPGTIFIFVTYALLIPFTINP